MAKYRFQVWQPIGEVDVEADSVEEAEEKCFEYGLDDTSEGIVFDPYCDGQEIEFRLENPMTE